MPDTFGNYSYDTNAAITTTGSANAYLLTSATPINAYYVGMPVIRFKANFANTGSATLNVNGLGAITLKKGGGATDLASGDIVSGGVYSVAYDGTNFQILELQAAFLPLTGGTLSGVLTISPGTSTANNDWLILKPTDWGTNKPYLALKKEATANQWTIILWDGTDTDGDLNINVGTGSIFITAGDVRPFGTITLTNTGLHLLDTNASHDLIIKPGSDITADRTLTVKTGDTDITVDLTDPGADKLMFWDDSAGQWTALTLGTNLTITGTTINAASSWTTVKKTADESRSSTTTLANDTDLQFSMAANTNYAIRMRIAAACVAASGFKYALTGPASPTLVKIQRSHWTSAAAKVDALDTAYTTSTGLASLVNGFFTFDIVVQNGANSGTFAFQWAQNSSGASATKVSAGSYLEYMTT